MFALRDDMKSNNLYITALEYAEEQLNNHKGVSSLELKEHLQKKGFSFDLEKEPDYSHFVLLYHAIIGEKAAVDAKTGVSNFTYQMSIGAYFNLIEYKELKEARKTSQNAMTRSTIAICVSIVAMIISSAISLYQTNTPTNLSDQTISELKNIKYDDSTIKISIESINAKQNAIINELKSTNSMKKTNKSLK